MPRINVKDKRKQQLIDANISSIAKRGLTETTIAHVSQGAGMSRGIVNFYFTTKESMMQETCQYLADEYAGAWERALEKAGEAATPEEQLRAIVAAHFSSALCSQKKLGVWVAFWGHAGSQAAYKKIIAAADAAFLGKVAEVWAKLPEAAISGDAFAYELHALIRGFWLNFLLSAQAADRDALAAKAQEFITRAQSGDVVVAETPKKSVKKVAKKEISGEDGANVTELAESKPAAKKKPKPAVVVEEEEQAALGDLFAMGR